MRIAGASGEENNRSASLCGDQNVITVPFYIRLAIGNPGEVNH